MNPNLASGVTGAAPIWHRIMSDLLAKNPETKQSTPEEVIQKLCFGKPEYFLKGTETNINCGPRTSPSSMYSNSPSSPTPEPKRKKKQR